MNTPTFLSLTLSALASVATQDAGAADIKNIVIVHGALADSSGWHDVTSLLEKKGFKVSLAQNPITSLQDYVTIRPLSAEAAARHTRT